MIRFSRESNPKLLPSRNDRGRAVFSNYGRSFYYVILGELTALEDGRGFRLFEDDSCPFYRLNSGMPELSHNGALALCADRSVRATQAWGSQLCAQTQSHEFNSPPGMVIAIAPLMLIVKTRDRVSARGHVDLVALPAIAQIETLFVLDRSLFPRSAIATAPR